MVSSEIRYTQGTQIAGIKITKKMTENVMSRRRINSFRWKASEFFSFCKIFSLKLVE